MTGGDEEALSKVDIRTVPLSPSLSHTQTHTHTRTTGGDRRGAEQSQPPQRLARAL